MRGVVLVALLGVVATAGCIEVNLSPALPPAPEEPEPDANRSEEKQGSSEPPP